MERNLLITGFADEMAPDLISQVQGLKKLNMSFVEMRGVDGNNLIYQPMEKVKEIKKYLDDNGIALSALGSPLGKIQITEDFSPHFEDFKRAVEIAHVMNTQNIRMFSFYIPGNECEKYEQAVLDRLGRFVEYAAANDIVLLHENEKGIYGELAKKCKKLMDTFYGEHFKAIFDFANFVQAGQDTLEAYDLLKPYIAYIHVKDARKGTGQVVPAGYGDGHVAEILKDLYANGFQGFLSLEPHLFNFAGFAALEQDKSEIEKSDLKILSGFEAFQAAHSALMNIFV